MKTPEESGYYNDPIFNEVISKVEKAIEEQTFEFRPSERWSIDYDLLQRVDLELAKFGWKIKKAWRGSKDDGHPVWCLEPIK